MKLNLNERVTRIIHVRMHGIGGHIETFVIERENERNKCNKINYHMSRLLIIFYSFFPFTIEWCTSAVAVAYIPPISHKISLFSPFLFSSPLPFRCLFIALLSLFFFSYAKCNLYIDYFSATHTHIGFAVPIGINPKWLIKRGKEMEKKIEIILGDLFTCL